jgi:uncharacterized protein YkwD
MPSVFRPVLLLTFAIASGLAASGELRGADTSALDRLNGFRTAAGLPKVTLDPELSRGCQAHAHYLAMNFDELRRRGLPTNDESPNLPGYQPDGKSAARVAFSGYQGRDAADLIDEWLATVFVRPLLLDPELRGIGWGQERAPRGGWFAVLDVTRGKGSRKVVIYPADGQKDVPLAYPGTELPDPIPQAKTKRAGYPVTIAFPAKVSVRDVRAVLSQGGKELPAWLSTPEKPAQDAGRQRNSIGLIAEEPFAENTTYAVTVSARVDGRPWQYQGSFTTGRAGMKSSALPKDRDGAARAVLEQVNGYRKQAGLEAVALDPILTRGCREHADYLVRNADKPATQGLGGHDEDPKLPGSTEEGRKAGAAADIAFDVEPAEAVPAWMSTLFHRLPLLDPNLRRIGFAADRGENSGWVVVMDVSRGKGSDRPVLFPAAGQKDVPVAYHAGERPDPIPQSTDRKAGYPVTVRFPPTVSVRDVRARLADADGRGVPVWVSTPEKTVDRDLQRNSVCLIAKQPLRAGSTYTVTVSARTDGDEWKQTWHFTTAGRP